MAPPSTAQKPGVGVSAESVEPVGPDHPIGAANTRSASAALNPVNLARKIVPSRTTPIEHLAFYATIAVLAVAEIIEPPIAALIVVGHRLHASHSDLLREIGSGVDAAT
jgi:hypothetical protein